MNSYTRYVLGITLICTGIVHASPQSVEIKNISGETATFTLVDSNGRSPVSVADNRIETPTSKSGFTRIYVSDETLESIALDLAPYSEKISVIYDGNVLLEESNYRLYKQSSQTKFAQYSKQFYQGLVGSLAVAQRWFANRWQQFKRWREQPRPEISAIAQITVSNQLDYDIEISGGTVMTNLKPIKPGHRDSIAFMANPLYIYKPRKFTTPLLVIDLTKYQKNPKPNADLWIFIKPSRWSAWMIERGWVSPVTYSVQWVTEYDLSPLEAVNE